MVVMRCWMFNPIYTLNFQRQKKLQPCYLKLSQSCRKKRR